jgi:hypothetical protein
MSAGYVIARENFKEASRHVSAEADPVMFNLLYGLQSLTNQIEADFAALRLSAAAGGEKAAARKSGAAPKKAARKKTATKAKSRKR